VTRGTRPKKPSSSYGFACEVHGDRGAWGLETENRIYLFFFKTAATTKNKNKNKSFYFYFYFFERPRPRPLEHSPSVRTADCVRRGGDGRGGKGRE
jgi:hypothetical protein